MTKNEFALAFNEVLEEKQLPKEIILRRSSRPWSRPTAGL